MGYGDAYVYLLVVSDEVVEKIKLLIEEIAGKQKLIDEIISDMDKDGELKPERGKKGLAIMDERKKLLMNIVCLCKKPIAIYDVADDSWLDAWHACSKLTYEPIKVSDVVKTTNGKMWCKDELMKKYPDRMCVLLPSHYDTDEDFREMVGVRTVRLEDYNSHRHTEPIDMELYAMVDLNTGAISAWGNRTGIANEWAEQKYKFGEDHYSVRKVRVEEIGSLSVKEIEQIVEDEYNRLNGENNEPAGN